MQGRVYLYLILFQAQLEDEKEKQRFGERLLHIDLERLNDETDKRKGQVGRKMKSPRKTHESVTEEVCYVTILLFLLHTCVTCVMGMHFKCNTVSYWIKMDDILLETKHFSMAGI